MEFSRSLVGLEYESSDYVSWHSSGIVVEHNGQKQIVTSAYILGNRSWEEGESLPVNVLLPNREKVPGIITYIDEHYNVAIVSAELRETDAASFDTNVFKLGDVVTAVGRRNELTIFPGKINIRKDHLESDNLMSSSCSINESGIGGPLVSNSSGKVIGMNFFSRPRTPFMPSNVLLGCENFIMRPSVRKLALVNNRT
ncbi:uncharacterized protein LOC141590787 [Silene latifolia]|uniref:uncharacterized protein LOC141590787 n=1 Tax=Silene latifolia TaxID=37657 RepID=UPI003D76DC8B